MPSSPGRSETREEESADPEPAEMPREEVDVTEFDRATLEERVVALEAEVVARNKEISTLEETLAHEEKHREDVIERYERILDRRDRERGGPDQFTPEHGGSRVTAVREFVDGLISRLR